MNKSSQQVLVIDDEPDIRELLSMTLARMDLATKEAGTVKEAKHLLREEKFDLCLTDMRLPDGSGIDLVRFAQEKYPHLPIAVITAYGNVESAVESLKAGAFDFVSKPVQLDDLRNLVAAALKAASPALDKELRQRHMLIGDSPAMQAIRGKIGKLARSQAPIYISGDSGTGKELVARLIHDQSARSEAPFVPVNCGAIPSELMESEFFGHKKGSFTGATADKPGLFQAADGGTLFLDEVAELPTHMQVKLLRAIQEKAVRPVGAQSEVPINARFLSATQRDLSGLVAKGKFREDLYYRINVIELRVPSLRERFGDIPLLVEHFLRRLNEDGPCYVLTQDAYAALNAHAFPGNVRELENILQRAVALSDSDTIDADDLGLSQSSRGSARSGFVPGDEPLEGYLARIEKQALIDALTRTSQNKTAAAKLLGMSFRSLRYKLDKFGID